MKRKVIIWSLILFVALGSVMLPFFFVHEKNERVESVVPLEQFKPTEETHYLDMTESDVVDTELVETTTCTEAPTEPTEDPELKKWEERKAEYPVATAVWKHLTEVMGYNNYVAAGIMGNIMSECGGQTLDIRWEEYSNSGFYGLCQWSYYFPEVIGADLQGQLDFMVHSFPEEIDYWGTICYKSGFTHDDFMNLQSAEEAAYAFCVIYERPAPGGEYQRQKNALKALEYFAPQGEGA